MRLDDNLKLGGKERWGIKAATEHNERQERKGQRRQEMGVR